MRTRRTLFRRMVLTQVAGMGVFLFFLSGTGLAILPVYVRQSDGHLLLPRLAPSDPTVAWLTGITLFLVGLTGWFFTAVLIAHRMNGIVEWILHQIGLRFGADWTRSKAIVPRVLPELEGWEEGINEKMSDLLLRSALVSGQVFLHEIGNHVNAISLRASGLQRHSQAVPERMNRLLKAIADTDEFLEDLSVFVDGTIKDLKLVNVIEMMEELPRKLFINRTRLKLVSPDRGQESLPIVNALKGMLLQVLLNLVQNALERSQDDVVVAVRVESNQVFIRVEDSAEMDERSIDDLFIIPPAPPGPRGQKHFGLGLPLCRAYMRAMGGSIEFRPANNSGRKAFEIVLPQASSQFDTSNGD